MELELESVMACVPRLELVNEMSENEMELENEMGCIAKLELWNVMSWNPMSWNPMSGKGLLLHS